MKIIVAACRASSFPPGAWSQTLDDLKNDGKIPTTFSPTAWAITKPVQPAQADRQDHRQAAGAGLESQPRQQLGRAGAADRLQWHDVRDQRARQPSRSTSPPASKSGSKRSTGHRKLPRVVCCGVSNKGAAIYNGKVFRTTLDAHVVASTPRPARRSGRARPPSGRKASR